MTQHLLGVIHGKTIELDSDPGLIDGEEVVVVVQPAQKKEKPGEGIRASAGSFADWPEADKYLEEILMERKRESSRENLE
ncbi:MAG TPA: hypothetical protein VGJ15_07395 [Pirellulales bacterium]|jgi:hypothetical protein